MPITSPSAPHPYATSAYAQSLAHWGAPLFVPAWETSVMVRADYNDAAGTYPFAVLASDIAGGLEFLRKQNLVSVVLVLDDFHRPPLEELKKHFTLVRPFKTHYIHRADKAPVQYDSHHRRALKKALACVRPGVMDLKKDWPHWQGLYEYLTRQLNLSGLHAFPAAHHQVLANLEGITGIGAWMDDELVSAHIWAGDGEYVHSHLVASSDKGYESRAAYATNDFSLKHFSQAKIINFGGGAGAGDAEGDGLARFKRGFSNDTAQSYICGTILDQKRYDELSGGRKTDYFPAYRVPK